MGIAVWRGYTKKAAPAPAVFLKNDVNFYDDYTREHYPSTPCHGAATTKRQRPETPAIWEL